MPKEDFNEKLIALLKTNPDFVDESDELLPPQSKTTHGNLPQPHQIVAVRPKNKVNLL